MIATTANTNPKIPIIAVTAFAVTVISWNVVFLILMLVLAIVVLVVDVDGMVVVIVVVVIVVDVVGMVVVTALPVTVVDGMDFVIVVVAMRAVHTVDDIDPEEPMNMSREVAFECTQEAPQSVCLKDLA